MRRGALSATVFISLLLAVALVVVSIQLKDAFYQVIQAVETQRQQSGLSDLMRQSTNELTRMVRLYAVTGDLRYLEYFNEILAIRNGEAPRPLEYDKDSSYWDYVLAVGERPSDFTSSAVALRSLLHDAGFVDSELALLEQSEDLSNDLVLLEEEVIALVREQTSAGGDYVLTGAVAEGLARLHGDEYHAAKFKILAPLGEFERAVERRALAEISGRQAAYEYLSNIQLALGLLLLLSVCAILPQLRARG